MTAYLFSCTDHFYENLDILLEFVNHPYFTDENVAKEQGIIGQEIRMYDDDPDWRVFFNALSAMYRNHPVKLDIAGTVIATGGSVVYSPAAMEHLRRMGKVIYLHLEYETMCRRIQNLDSRGVVLQGGYTLQDMYKERLPLYRRYADAVIKCDNNTVEQTAQQIARCAR